MSYFLSLTLTCLTLLFALPTQQEKSGSLAGPRSDECGDPVRISQAYVSLRGKAANVIDGACFTMLLDDGRKKEIHLIGLDAPKLTQRLGVESRQHLSDLISGKRIVIYFSDFTMDKREKMTVLVGTSSSASFSSVNLEQLRAGLARTKRAGPALDSWQACHYDRAEKEAQQARRGLWQGSAGR